MQHCSPGAPAASQSAASPCSQCVCVWAVRGQRHRQTKRPYTALMAGRSRRWLRDAIASPSCAAVTNGVGGEGPGSCRDKAQLAGLLTTALREHSAMNIYGVWLSLLCTLTHSCGVLMGNAGAVQAESKRIWPAEPQSAIQYVSECRGGIWSNSTAASGHDRS